MVEHVAACCIVFNVYEDLHRLFPIIVYVQDGHPTVSIQFVLKHEATSMCRYSHMHSGEALIASIMHFVVRQAQESLVFSVVELERS